MTGEDLRWTTGAVLLALGTRDLGKGQTFNSAQLAKWVPQLGVLKRRRYATHKLLEMGFVTARNQFTDEAKTDLIGHYTITEAGEAAIQAAMDGIVPRSGPRCGHGATRRPAPDSFVNRLWALFRARQIIDSDTAASTLVDAGGDVIKARETASRYLNRWTKAGVCQESAQRVNAVGTSRGFKRYVLVNDCGPTPPDWTARARTRTNSNNPIASRT